MNLADKTKDFLGSSGWGKGAYRNNDGYCLVGGLRQAASGDLCMSQGSDYHNAAAKLYDVISNEYSDRIRIPHADMQYAGPLDYIIAFNDHQDTEFTDVERVLEKASARLDESAGL